MNTKQLLIRVPEELKRRLVAEAKEKGLTVNALVINILWERLGDALDK